MMRWCKNLRLPELALRSGRLFTLNEVKGGPAYHNFTTDIPSREKRATCHPKAQRGIYFFAIDKQDQADGPTSPWPSSPAPQPPSKFP
jgi:hypothetical protein